MATHCNIGNGKGLRGKIPVSGDKNPISFVGDKDWEKKPRKMKRKRIQRKENK